MSEDAGVYGAKDWRRKGAPGLLRAVEHEAADCGRQLPELKFSAKFLFASPLPILVHESSHLIITRHGTFRNAGRKDTDNITTKPSLPKPCTDGVESKDGKKSAFVKSSRCRQSNVERQEQ
ncbi:hypothetical protein ARMGADRAFT_1027481 [Armillaria gallica]|uniref:Uncharacterized protein n=1 Tax=Armillaria gallica TaxID=47427 RepID=A0A2H3E9S8_ARMGA|nr:hypothetical protein ARMGADRAFT_1027481 [Armillaria gallica]